MKDTLKILSVVSYIKKICNSIKFKQVVTGHISCMPFYSDSPPVFDRITFSESKCKTLTGQYIVLHKIYNTTMLPQCFESMCMNAKEKYS